MTTRPPDNGDRHPANPVVPRSPAGYAHFSPGQPTPTDDPAMSDDPTRTAAPDPGKSDPIATVAPGDPLPTATAPTAPQPAALETLDHAPDADDLPAGPLGPPGYDVVGELGRGGMGVVYRARQAALKREVALKVVLAGVHASPAHRQRFLAEAEAVAALNHPGVVQVFEAGTWAGQPFLALEYCPGGTLSARLAGTPLPSRDAATLVGKLATAVQAAHDLGIIHRDLKPGNVLFAADGSPKVADFGIAKFTGSEDGATATGAVLGTPSYMAPEQARGDAKRVGPAADVYALGAVLYECLTGRPPFRGATAADTLLQVLGREPVGVRALNPAAPVDLETVCLKCLEKDPARRYPSAALLADDLGLFLTGRPVTARPVGPLGRTRRWAVRNPAVAGLLVAVVVAVAAGVGGTYWKYQEARAEATAKEQALEALRDTAERLANEKTAAEDTLLRGLLRPLRTQPGSIVRLEEAVALEALAALPEERLRARFVTLALGTSGGSAKLVVRAEEVVWAVAGTDRAVGERLREPVRVALLDPGTGPAGQAACITLALALPLGDQDLDGLAVRVLADRMAAADGDALELLAPAARRLAARARPADAATAARVLTGRMEGRSSRTLAVLGEAVADLTGRLKPDEAAVVVGPPASLLAARMTAEADPTLLPQMSSALTALTGRLGSDEAAAVTGPVVRALLRRLAEGRPGTESDVAGALWGLAERLSPTDAAAAARTLADQITGRNPYEPASLAHTLARMAGRLGPGEAAAVTGPVVRALAARVVTVADPRALPHDVEALSMVAIFLSTEEVAEVARRPARALADRLAAASDVDTLAALAEALSAVAEFLPSEEAAAVVGPPARAVAGRIADGRDPYALWKHASVLARLAGRLRPGEAAAVTGPVARALATRVAGTPARHLSLLCGALGQLAGSLGPDDTAAVARALADRAVAEADPAGLSFLCSALGVYAERLAPRNAEVAARVIADRVVTEANLEATEQLVGVLVALGGGLGPTERARVVRAITRRITEETDVVARQKLVFGLARLAGWLDDADLLTLLQVHGPEESVRPAVLAEFGRRSGRTHTSAVAAVAGAGAAFGAPSPPFADVWEFADWIEKHRPDLDLRSRPPAPGQ